MKRLAAIAVLSAALAIPAQASAERINSSVSIHRTFLDTQIHGVVQAPEHKCERGRTILLYYQPENETGFEPVVDVTTDNLGQYLIETKGFIPPGQYFVRALRKEAGKDVCKPAESRVITVQGQG